MKHYLYKITNLQTNQYYLGVRSTKKDPLIDSYMGSSSVWTKQWIKENKDLLEKEILDDSFLNRESANLAEVNLLKCHKDDKLCINCLFDSIPSHLGKKQSEEWIKNRILSGDKHWLYGKHHSEETKNKISESLKGRIITKEAKEKIGNAHRGKIVTEQQKQKQSETRKSKIASGEIKKTYKPVVVEDLLLNTIEYFDGCKLFAEKYNLNYGSVQVAAYKERTYLKRYNIKYAASTSNSSRTLGENGK